MLSEAELKAMRARCQAATAGPWAAERDFAQGSYTVIAEDGDDLARGLYSRDVAFVANSRSDLPRCLDEIERLRLEVTEWENEGARLRRVEEAARKVHFWNESAEPTADLAFDDAMAELGKALEGEG